MAFAFVTMGSEADAQTAITKFNGQTVEGRPLTVNEARPREARPPGGGGGGRRSVATAAAVAAAATVVAAAVTVAAAVVVADATVANVADVKRYPSRRQFAKAFLGQPQAAFRTGPRASRSPGRDLIPRPRFGTRTGSEIVTRRVFCSARGSLSAHSGLTLSEKLVGKNA